MIWKRIKSTALETLLPSIIFFTILYLFYGSMIEDDKNHLLDFISSHFVIFIAFSIITSIICRNFYFGMAIGMSAKLNVEKLRNTRPKFFLSLLFYIFFMTAGIYHIVDRIQSSPEIFKIILPASHILTAIFACLLEYYSLKRDFNRMLDEKGAESLWDKEMMRYFRP